MNDKQDKDKQTIDDMTIIDNNKWKACVSAMTDENLQKLSEWRGYSMEFCLWLRDNELIGVYEVSWAFPVKNEEGDAVGVHYRMEEAWRYTAGTKAAPL